MIEFELIADQYDEIEYGEYDQRINKLLHQDLNRFARKRYLQKTFQDTISSPTIKEIKEAIANQNKRLFVHNFFLRDSSSAIEVKKRLQGGEPFQKITIELDPAEKSRLWDYGSGWIKWGDLELSVEDQLYQLEYQQISRPIRSSLGWHIFRIDSQQVTYNLAKSDLAKLKNDVSYQLKHRKLVAAAAPHINKIVKQRQLAVSMKTARKVWQYLYPALSESGKKNVIYSFQKFRDDLPRNLLAEPLAWVDNEVFTVEDFVDEIEALPRYLLRPNLKKAIEGAIHNKVLAEVALDAGFGTDPVVEEKLQRSRINYRYSAIISGIDSSLYISKIDPVEYYNDNMNRFVKSIETEIEEIIVTDRKLALDIAGKMKEGGNFEVLAKQYSIYAKDGQAITRRWVDSGEEQIGKKAAQLQKGQIFAPVQIQGGYSVVRVIDKEVKYLPYDLVKNQVKKYISQNKSKFIRKALLPNKYSPGDIQYFEDNIIKAFTEATKTIF